MVLLIYYDVSPLVIDALCKQAAGGNTNVTCFYVDFATQEEQSLAPILGSILKQVVGGLNEVPQKLVEAFRDSEKVIGGQRLAPAEIVEFLQDISSSRRTVQLEKFGDKCQNTPKVPLFSTPEQPHLI